MGNDNKMNENVNKFLMLTTELLKNPMIEMTEKMIEE